MEVLSIVCGNEILKLKLINEPNILSTIVPDKVVPETKEIVLLYIEDTSASDPYHRLENAELDKMFMIRTPYPTQSYCGEYSRSLDNNKLYLSYPD